MLYLYTRTGPDTGSNTALGAAAPSLAGCFLADPKPLKPCAFVDEINPVRIPREVSPQLLRGKRERAALPTSDHCAAFSLAGTGITMNTFNGSVLLSTSFSSSLHVFQSRQTGSCFASLRCFFLSQRLLESKTVATQLSAAVTRRLARCGPLPCRQLIRGLARRGLDTRQPPKAMRVERGLALQYAPLELRSDWEVVMCAVSKSGTALMWASNELQADKEVVLKAVQENGGALEYAAQELRADRDVVLAAVCQRGAALRYAAEELRADRDIVLAAARQSKRSLMYAADALKKNADFIQEASNQKPLPPTVASELPAGRVDPLGPYGPGL
ncbi:unnamed protein product [Symbiodinium natans]|uniref:DUF4116 domain-containing protein n=1 Tax=Symbiodinium natans TaxID=878477 RepID=A0A812SRF4_9DINO|nr:unnamed protein product [Symbiodinium natans]